jgi:hypothetical protein
MSYSEPIHEADCRCAACQTNGTSRKDFIKTLGLTLGAGLLAGQPVSALAASSEALAEMEGEGGNKPLTVSILQTTDVHCQIHPLD